MKLNKILIFTVFSVIFIATIVYLVNQNKKVTYNSNKIRVGISHETMEAMTLIAYKKNYFSAQGLDAQLDHYPTEKEALDDGLLNNRVDIVASSTTPLVIHYINGNRIQIIGVMARSNDQIKILVPNKEKTLKISNLKNKKIGVVRGSFAQYYIDQLLKQNGVTNREYEYIYADPDKLIQMAIKKDINMIVLKEPFVSRAKKLLGESMTELMPTGNPPTQAYVLVARKGFLENNPEKVNKFIRAIIFANGFINNNPDQAKAILTNDNLYSLETVNLQWPTVDFGLTLDNNLIDDLKDQAGWVRANSLIVGKNIFEIDGLIYSKTLKTVNSQMVDIGL